MLTWNVTGYTACGGADHPSRPIGTQWEDQYCHVSTDATWRAILRGRSPDRWTLPICCFLLLTHHLSPANYPVLTQSKAIAQAKSRLAADVSSHISVQRKTVVSEVAGRRIDSPVVPDSTWEGLERSLKQISSQFVSELCQVSARSLFRARLASVCLSLELVLRAIPRGIPEGGLDALVVPTSAELAVYGAVEGGLLRRILWLFVRVHVAVGLLSTLGMWGDLKGEENLGFMTLNLLKGMVEVGAFLEDKFKVEVGGICGNCVKGLTQRNEEFENCLLREKEALEALLEIQFVL